MSAGAGRATTRLLSLVQHCHGPRSSGHQLTAATLGSLRTRSMTTVDNQTTGAAAPAGATTSTQPAQAERPKYNFPVSEVPKNPLGEGRYIKTAAALVIGYVYPCETVAVHEEVNKRYTQRRDSKRQDLG